jgi:diadenylate cyclase
LTERLVDAEVTDTGMTLALLQAAKNLVANLRVADLVDIVVVAVLFYGIVGWLRFARSRFVLTGAAALLGLYLLARAIDLRLTLFLFEAGVTVALVALVVVFQEDIRRTFERFATGRLLAFGRSRTVAHDVVDTLVGATSTMARQHTGALIVLRGREPLERHLSDGVPLEGRLSEQLLFSIFDPSSPGHDGALIIENGIASRFGVHLPLSTTSADARLGTRHTAALGLAERSDALVIVVSEERGSVSVVQDGHLSQLESTAELEQRITGFLAGVMPEGRVPWYRRWFARNLGSKTMSLVAACAAWAVIAGYAAETYTRTFTVPVVYRFAPDGWWLDPPDPMKVRLILQGSALAFRNVDPQQLTVSLDVSRAHAGTERYPLDSSVLELPKSLTLRSIEPRFVWVKATRTVNVTLPVRPQLVGELPSGVRLQAVTVRPTEVKLVVPVRDQDGLIAVQTGPIALEDIHENADLVRQLVLPADGRLAEGQPEEVEVHLSLAPR